MNLKTAIETTKYAKYTKNEPFVIETLHRFGEHLNLRKFLVTRIFNRKDTRSTARRSRNQGARPLGRFNVPSSTNVNKVLVATAIRAMKRPKGRAPMPHGKPSQLESELDDCIAKRRLLSPFLCALRVFPVDSDASNFVAAPLLRVFVVSQVRLVSKGKPIRLRLRVSASPCLPLSPP